MLLQTWLDRQNLTQTEFARRLAVSPASVSDLCSGKQWPRRHLARAIERETDGQVTANDFVHLGPQQAVDAQAAA
jgi:3,4-dihydroxy 2-butanone 4-phosphate synthase/GTP cyclohydrolase II